MEDEEYLTAHQARELLGVSKTRMTEILKRRRIQPFRREIDGRVKWVRKQDVERLVRELYEARSEVRA